MPRRPLSLAAIALAAGALASGCGGSSTSAEPDRQAAGAGDTRTCAPRNPSFTYEAKIANTLPFAVMLRASEYDCSDWDGVSTPGRSFTGKVLKPGETRTFILQAVKYEKPRDWTMEFVGESGSPSYGKARLNVPLTRALGEPDRIEVAGATKDYGPTDQRGPGPDKCQFLALGAITAPDTRWTQIDWFWKVPLSLVSRDGRFTLASVCSAD